MSSVVKECQTHVKQLRTHTSRSQKEKKMGLMIATDASGKTRGTWHGIFMLKGKWRKTNLNVPIEGKPPTDKSGRITLNERGDAAFERSRKAAQKAFDAWRKTARSDPAELVKKAYKARTGVSLEGVPLAKLAERWIGRKRERNLSAKWQQMIETWFSKFARFAESYARARGGRKCETINDITPAIAAAWFEDIKKCHAWETVLKMMHLMSGAYRRFSTTGMANPFGDIVMSKSGDPSERGEFGNERVPRKPLLPDQIERLFECAQENSELYPLIVTAACTGMRVGDVCNLKWRDVDLKEGLIDTVTAKSHSRVTIPIFGRLRDVLTDCAAIDEGESPASPFVFPRAAERYKRNANGLYLAVKPYFARAVFGDKPPAHAIDVMEDGSAEPVRDLSDVIDSTGFSDTKRTRIMEVYRRIKSGEKCIDIASSLNVARSQVSMDLREIEGLTGEVLRPMAKKMKSRANWWAQIDRTRAKRKIGDKAASLYGWHSLRATFVVLAYEAGVPLADVQKVVGHSTVEMTLQYYNPDKKLVAERVRQRMAGSVLDVARPKSITRPPKNSLVLADKNAAQKQARTIDDLIAGMSKKQKQALMNKLVASM